MPPLAPAEAGTRGWQLVIFAYNRLGR